MPLLFNANGIRLFFGVVTLPSSAVHLEISFCSYIIFRRHFVKADISGDESKRTLKRSTAAVDSSR